RAGQSLAGRRPRGRGRIACGGGERLMGEILIAGLASLLISIFLGPKYIQFLRDREFGQHIREEGPAEHQVKAGTPTMGGLVVFTAIGIPYLILSQRDAASLAVFGTALASAAIGFA